CSRSAKTTLSVIGKANQTTGHCCYSGTDRRKRQGVICETGVRSPIVYSRGSTRCDAGAILSNYAQRCTGESLRHDQLQLPNAAVMSNLLKGFLQKDPMVLGAQASSPACVPPNN